MENTLPPLDKIRQLTSKVGIYQHGALDQPTPVFGYALEDQARALIIAHEFGAKDLEEIYLNFIIRGRSKDVFLNQYYYEDKRGFIEDITPLTVLDRQEAYGITLWALFSTNNFQNEKIKAFGPTKKAAEIEWSKEWSRDFMTKYKLPTPNFKIFKNKKEAIKYVESLPDKLLFIKASGLALGKGVIKAENKREAKEAIEQMDKFGKSGDTFLIEEGLVGEEFTLFAICDGNDFVITKSSQDHKTIFDQDRGPNTGGVGSISPTGVINKKQLKEIEEKINNLKEVEDSDNIDDIKSKTSDLSQVIQKIGTEMYKQDQDKGQKKPGDKGPEAEEGQYKEK